ncbi:hypothetical protein J0667_21500 [Methylomonas sp. WH-1]|nr:hypothetical protein [Methylomonas sp. LW13]
MEPKLAAAPVRRAERVKPAKAETTSAGEPAANAFFDIFPKRLHQISL